MLGARASCRADMLAPWQATQHSTDGLLCACGGPSRRTGAQVVESPWGAAGKAPDCAGRLPPAAAPAATAGAAPGGEGRRRSFGRNDSANSADSHTQGRLPPRLPRLAPASIKEAEGDTECAASARSQEGSESDGSAACGQGLRRVGSAAAWEAADDAALAVEPKIGATSLPSRRYTQQEGGGGGRGACSSPQGPGVLIW